jgi:type IV pilus assembly protein PilY1
MIMIVTSRANAARIGLLLTLGVWHTASFSTSTDLADTPLPVVSSVEPNVLFMLDSSGSMSNIAPDAPYDPAVAYLDSCPNILLGGAASVATLNGGDTLDIAIRTDGAASIKATGAGNASSGKTFGTDAGQFCFNPSLYYNARLNADSTLTSNGASQCGSAANAPCNYPSSNYLDAVYTGNFLNWYFCTGAAPNCNTAANFGADARRKAGTSTRLEIARTASKNIVDSLDKVRVGLARYNSTTSGFGGELVVQLGSNLSAQKTTIKTAIDAVTAFGNTPLAETLSGIGSYFAKVPSGTPVNLKLHPGKSGQSPDYLNESTAAASTVFSGHGTSLRNGVAGSPAIAAPIQYACQKSFAVLVTDGRPQGDQSVSGTGGVAGSSLCDYLGVIGSCPTTGANQYGRKGAANGVATLAGYHVNGNNVQLHLGDAHDYESEGSDYLDDVAAALYDIDLRPDLAKTGGMTGAKNNVLTYTIGFADAQAINDPLLKEAAAAGGGLSLTANTSGELVTAFQLATDDILAKDGSAAAVAVANAHVTNLENKSFATSYNSGTWSGDLIAYPIDIATGVPNNQTPVWRTGCDNPDALVIPGVLSKGILGCSAQVQLDLQTSGTRKIFTSNETGACFHNCGVPFQPYTDGGTAGTQISQAQQDLLNTPSLTDGANVVRYLRGDRSGEAATYRPRAHLFGDTVNAEPLVVRQPDRNYRDLGYSNFKTAQAARTQVVIQAANDGMLHAFNAATGAEEWAYIPNLLISSAKDPVNSTTSLLNTRSRKTSFNHYFLLDGTPVVADIDFNNAGSTGNLTTNWGTIVVGGLGKGGRGYYALDVTSTTTTADLTQAEAEAEAAAKVLWEFPSSITDPTLQASARRNMGYSFAKPIVVKTAAKGWVVLFTSGYNNGTNSGDSGGDGLGHLYVVNAKTGDLIADLTTTGCHTTPAANPCGLSSINAYVETKDIDNTAEIVYGGDLYGNLYRFDLRSPTSGTPTIADWSVSKMAKLRSGALSGSPVQPITTAPELSKITMAGTDRYFVYIGTGMYLGKSDLPCPPDGAACTWTPDTQSTQTQTMYGLIDPRDGSTLSDPLRGVLIEQTYTTDATTLARTFSRNTFTYPDRKGWYTDFTGGERLVTDSSVASGVLVFTSVIPSTSPCIPGGSSYLYALDYETGAQVANTLGGTFLGNALASRPVLIQLPNGSIKAIVRLSDTTTKVEPVPATGTATAGRRVSWRELLDK